MFVARFRPVLSEIRVAQPIVLCPHCLVLLMPTKITKGKRPILYYMHQHNFAWIHLLQSENGKRTYRTNRDKAVEDLMQFAGMGWIRLNWSVLQVAYYIYSCLTARKQGKEMDALLFLLGDFTTPSVREKMEILKALGWE
jgi:hypothetical protein